MSTLSIVAINEQIIDADISDQACGIFGFKHVEKIIDPFGRSGIVIGVGPIPDASGCTEKGTDVLWVAIDELAGKVCFFPNPSRDLQRA